MEQDPKEYVSLYIASHGKRSHHFPGYFKALFLKSKVQRQRFHSVPRIFATGGGVMGQPLVDEIESRALQAHPKRQYIVVCSGDNNIRRGQTVSDLLPYFSQIVAKVEAIPYCRVVFTSLVPTFGRDEQTREEFKKMEDALRTLSNTSPKASFCSFVPKLMVRGKLHEDFFEDDVHLSPAGAKILAECIHRHLENKPRIKE